MVASVEVRITPAEHNGGATSITAGR